MPRLNFIVHCSQQAAVREAAELLAFVYGRKPEILLVVKPQDDKIRRQSLVFSRKYKSSSSMVQPAMPVFSGKLAAMISGELSPGATNECGDAYKELLNEQSALAGLQE